MGESGQNWGNIKGKLGTTHGQGTENRGGRERAAPCLKRGRRPKFVRIIIISFSYIIRLCAFSSRPLVFVLGRLRDEGYEGMKTAGQESRGSHAEAGGGAGVVWGAAEGIDEASGRGSRGETLKNRCGASRRKSKRKILCEFEFISTLKKFSNSSNPYLALADRTLARSLPRSPVHRSACASVGLSVRSSIRSFVRSYGRSCARPSVALSGC